jgi:nucleoside-diphosphate-sugar epimerase
MKVLLTGGSGFLGSHIAEQLSASGYSVRALVRPTSDTRDLLSLKNVELFDAPLEDSQALQSAMAGVTHVIHSAGLVKARSPEDFHRVNAQGTQRLLEAAKQNPELQRFVLVSSLAVAGPSLDGLPVVSLGEPSPVTHYGRSKLAAERAALAHKDQVPLTIIRPPFIYGPRDRECFAFFKAVKLGVFPYMGTLQRNLSAIYATDCAAACVAALSAPSPSGTVYFVEDGQTQTLGQLIGHIETAMGKRAWLRLPVPKRALEFAAFGSELFGKFSDRAVMLTRDKCNELYAPHWVCDASQTRLDLGWEPRVQFAEGARVTLAWYQRAGWL